MLTKAVFKRYFINNVDEIRSIENPDYYFKYYLTKNERWNERHRFAFDRIPFPIAIPMLKVLVPLPLTVFNRSGPQRDPRTPRHSELHHHPPPTRHASHGPARPDPHDPRPRMRKPRGAALWRVVPAARRARAPRDQRPRRHHARLGAWSHCRPPRPAVLGHRPVGPGRPAGQRRRAVVVARGPVRADAGGQASRAHGERRAPREVPRSEGERGSG